MQYPDQQRRMSPELFAIMRASHLSDDEIYQRLCAAGLGNVEQDLITADQMRRALRGEVVVREWKQLGKRI